MFSSLLPFLLARPLLVQVMRANQVNHQVNQVNHRVIQWHHQVNRMTHPRRHATIILFFDFPFSRAHVKQDNFLRVMDFRKLPPEKLQKALELKKKLDAQVKFELFCVFIVFLGSSQESRRGSSSWGGSSWGGSSRSRWVSQHYWLLCCQRYHQHIKGRRRCCCLCTWFYFIFQLMRAKLRGVSVNDEILELLKTHEDLQILDVSINSLWFFL